MSNYFDIVSCVSDTHVEIAIKSIRSLIKYSGAKRYFIISTKDNNKYIKKNLPNLKNLICIDEDKLFKNFKKSDVSEIISNEGGDPRRSGWYFQQFLKMEFARTEFCSKYYLIWDCDTIMLRKINFFTKEGLPIINISHGCHKPYFDFLNSIGLIKREKYSFISENLLIDSRIMRDLIKFIENTDKENVFWFKKVLCKINKEDLSKSGFSEFETYGTYLTTFYSKSFLVRNLKFTRKGYALFGDPNNNKTFIALLIYGYYWATFGDLYINYKRTPIKKFIIQTIKFFNSNFSKTIEIFLKLFFKNNFLLKTSKYLAKTN